MRLTLKTVSLKQLYHIAQHQESRTPVKLNNHGKTTVKNNTFGTANDGVYYNAVEFDVGSETS